MVSVAYGRPRPLPLACATTSLSPSTRPVIRPTRRCPEATYWNCPRTSRPFSRSASFSGLRLSGSATSTSASPPLMRSARFDSVRISTLCGGNCGAATAAVAASRRPAKTARVCMESPLSVAPEVPVAIEIEMRLAVVADFRLHGFDDGVNRIVLEDEAATQVVARYAHHLVQIGAVAAIERVERRDVERQVIAPARAGA